MTIGSKITESFLIRLRDLGIVVVLSIIIRDYSNNDNLESEPEDFISTNDVFIPLPSMAINYHQHALLSRT
jgi:hypothetical protein